MLVLGPTFVFLIACVAFVLFVKYITVEDRPIRVVREEQLFNRETESQRTDLPVKSTNILPQREPVTRDTRVGKNRIVEEDDRDPGIV